MSSPSRADLDENHGEYLQTYEEIRRAKRFRESLASKFPGNDCSLMYQQIDKAIEQLVSKLDILADRAQKMMWAIPINRREVK